MKIVETKSVQIESVTDVLCNITDVLCNKCGESCVPLPLRPNNIISKDFYGLIEATVSGGYYSYALSDCCNYTFSLCEGCLKELFDSFKLPVEAKEYM